MSEGYKQETILPKDFTPKVLETDFSKWREADRKMDQILKDLKEKIKADPSEINKILEVTSEPPTLPIWYGESKIVLQGHLHHIGQFETFKETILTHLQNSSVIVCEMHTHSQILRDGDIDAEFFTAVLEACRLEQKPVVAVDHMSHPGVDEELLQAQFKTVTGAQEAAVQATTISALALLGIGGVQALRKKLTRREFLLGSTSLAGLTITDLLLRQSKFLSQELDAPRITNPDTKTGSALTLSKRDMRDVLSAYAGLLLIQGSKSATQVGYIYGADHVKDIAHYLVNPIELAIKYSIYTNIYPNLLPEMKVLVPQRSPANSSGAEKDWLTVDLNDFLKQHHQKQL